MCKLLCASSIAASHFKIYSNLLEQSANEIIKHFFVTTSLAIVKQFISYSWSSEIELLIAFER